MRNFRASERTDRKAERRQAKGEKPLRIIESVGNPERAPNI